MNARPSAAWSLFDSYTQSCRWCSCSSGHSHRCGLHTHRCLRDKEGPNHAVEHMRTDQPQGEKLHVCYEICQTRFHPKLKELNFILFEVNANIEDHSFFAFLPIRITVIFLKKNITWKVWCIVCYMFFYSKILLIIRQFSADSCLQKSAQST